MKIYNQLFTKNISHTDTPSFENLTFQHHIVEYPGIKGGLHTFSVLTLSEGWTADYRDTLSR